LATRNVYLYLCSRLTVIWILLSLFVPIFPFIPPFSSSPLCVTFRAEMSFLFLSVSILFVSKIHHLLCDHAVVVCIEKIDNNNNNNKYIRLLMLYNNKPFRKSIKKNMENIRSITHNICFSTYFLGKALETKKKTAAQHCVSA
jgi:hypothetical protein